MFRNIGILALACFSFLVTDETIMVVKENDKLMLEIREKSAEYYIFYIYYTLTQMKKNIIISIIFLIFA